MRVVIGPVCPDKTLALKVPPVTGACHPKEMKPRRGGVVLLAPSVPFFGNHIRRQRKTKNFFKSKK